MVVETTVLDLMVQRLVSINPSKAMECLLLVLLTNMPRLLRLEDLEHLLFMVVTVHWVEVWETMVVLDRPSVRIAVGWPGQDGASRDGASRDWG